MGVESNVNALTSEVSGTYLGSGVDHWICKLSGDGIFSVSSLRQVIDKLHVSIPGTSEIVWSRVVPIKVLCFIWRAAQDRIPSAAALEKRGSLVNSLWCSSCIGRTECADHILIDCPFATLIRNNILSWCGVRSDQISIKTIGDLLHFTATWGICNSKRERFTTISYRLLWNLWRFQEQTIISNGGYFSTSRGLNALSPQSFIG